MASLQDAFYRSQQTKYQEVEPNRILPDAIKGSLGDSIFQGAKDALSVFDPYTTQTVNPFTEDGLKSLFEGTPKDVAELTRCRQYSGLKGLEQLIRDTQDNPNAPLRCGWRYKKSPGGLCPEISQGALGSSSGPLDRTSEIDSLGNGVTWIWDLKAAQKTILTDASQQTKTGEGLQVANAVCGNDYQGKLGYCETTKKVIPVLADGRPMYPTDPLLTCPPAKLITDPARIPPPSLTNATASFQQVALRELADCANTGRNPSLTRDCLLQAIKNNGCSSDGTLYTSLQAVDPNQPKWDAQLKAQASFQAYQSKQGNNAFTEKLFQTGMSDWNQAIQEVSRLQRTAQNASDPYTRVAARDLCTSRGRFDVYDFCSEIAESAAIGTVDLKCLQRFWQEQNGKPAGMAYPNSLRLDPQLGTINTYGDFKAAVRRLKALTTTNDPIAQRTANNNFYGVRVSATPFNVKNVLGAEPDQSAPCFGVGQASPDRAIRLYSKQECDLLNGTHFPSGECLMPRGGSYSWACRYLNAEPDSPLQFWIDVMDSSSFVIDGKNGIRTVKDKSGRGRDLVQNQSFLRPLYTRSGTYGGMEFSGTNQFFEIPNASAMVRNQFTIFVVERRKSDKMENYFMGGTTLARNTNLVLGYYTSTQGNMAFWSNDTLTTIPGFRGTTEPTRMWCFRKPAGAKEIYVNGGPRAAGNSNPDTLQSWNGAALGRYFDRFYQGIIYEVLVYNQALSDDVRQKVEGYLSHKWAITENLPANHPFKASPP
jgi:hypothetical protein